MSDFNHAPEKNRSKQSDQASALKKIALVLLVIVAAVGGLWFYNHNAAVKAYELGDYEEAMEVTFFDNVMFVKASCKLGEQYLDEGDYQTAYSILQTAAEDKYQKAAGKAARECAESGDPAAALACASLLSGEDRAELLSQLGQLMTVEENPGMLYPYCQAHWILTIDPGGNHSEVYLERALSYLQDSGNYRNAPQYIRILETISDQEYLAAIEMIQELPADEKAIITNEIWSEILNGSLNQRNWISKESTVDLNCYLSGKAALRYLQDQTTYDASDIAELVDSSGSMIKALPDGDEEYGVESVQQIYEICGSNPGGKILILRETAPFNYDSEVPEDPTCAVAYDLMNMLPLEYLPESVDEVSYVITISYSFLDVGTYQGTGGYTGIVKALMEMGFVTAYSIELDEQFYVSDIVFGPEPPEDATLTGRIKDRDYRSGGRPLVASQFLEALDATMAMATTQAGQ